MQNRIDRLENLVLSLMTNGSQAGGPAAALAAISGNSSSTGSVPHTGDVDIEDDAPNAPEESDTEQVTKSFGIMKVDNNKSWYFSEAHWATVMHDVRLSYSQPASIVMLMVLSRSRKSAISSRRTKNSTRNKPRNWRQRSCLPMFQALHYCLELQSRLAEQKSCLLFLQSIQRTC